jgi:hypothetical protein
VAPRSLCGASPGISVGAGRFSVAGFENALPGLRQATPVLPGPYFDRFVHASRTRRCRETASTGPKALRAISRGADQRPRSEPYAT